MFNLNTNTIPEWAFSDGLPLLDEGFDDVAAPELCSMLPCDLYGGGGV